MQLSQGSQQPMGASAPYQSAIAVECHHGSLPLAQAKVTDVLTILFEHLSLSPQGQLKQILPHYGANLQSMSIKQLDEMVSAAIAFEDGSFEVSRKGHKDMIQIVSATVSSPSSLMVAVYGTSDDAEEALGKFYEYLCQAAKVNRTWAEGQKAVAFRRHITSSLERLDCSLGTLLSADVAKKLNETFGTGGSLLPNIGYRRVDAGKVDSGQKHFVGNVKLGSLTVTVTRMDPDSGNSEVADLSIHPHSKFDAGVGVYAIKSALPYNEHVQFVAELKKSLKC